MNKQRRVRTISDELMSIRGAGRQVVPFSRRYEDFGLAGAIAV